MTETSDQLYARMLAAAQELKQQNSSGALHIFVEDGNCEDEMIEFCLADPMITETEATFAVRMLEQFTEEQRFGIYAFAQCPTNLTPVSEIQITPAMLEAGTTALYRACGYQVPDNIDEGVKATFLAMSRAANPGAGSPSA